MRSTAYGWSCQASSAGLDDETGAARGVGVVAGGVEHDRPPPAAGQADAVGLLRLAAEVHDAGDDRGVGRPVARAEAQPRERVVGGVVGLEPLEARAVGVELPQRAVAAVDPVEVLDEVVDAVVQRLLEQPPVEAAALGPLGLLAELAAHEEQLLAGVAPEVGEEGAQRRHLLLARAARLAQQRALAVDDLVVADRQHEVLVEGVHEREGQLAVVVAAVDRAPRRGTSASRSSSPCST